MVLLKALYVIESNTKHVIIKPRQYNSFKIISAKECLKKMKYLTKVNEQVH